MNDEDFDVFGDGSVVVLSTPGHTLGQESRASRARVERFIEENGAALWIEHDIATHVSLPKPPAYVD